MKGFRAHAERISLLAAPWVCVHRTKALSVICESVPVKKLMGWGLECVQLITRQPFKHRLFDELSRGLALEGLAAIALSH